jgi:hypothetical protein
VIVGVDNARFVVHGLTPGIDIIEMNMPVNQIPGFKYIHEETKKPETPVAGVLFIVNMPGRSVGKQDIQVSAVAQPVPEKSGKKTESKEEHSDLGKLVVSPVVAHAAPQPGDQQPLYLYRFSSHIGGTVGMVMMKGFRIKAVKVTELPAIVLDSFQVMVSKDKTEGNIQGRDDKTVVFKMEIPRRQNKLNIREAIFYTVGINQRVHMVGNAEDLHESFTALPLRRAFRYP